MPITGDERYYIKLKAAYLYYVEDKTQSEIAQLFHISRPTLIKLLKDAKQEGIVNIEIRDVCKTSSFIKLERDLCAFLSLVDVRIVPTSGPQTIGNAAAAYLLDILQPGMTVGIGRGLTISTAARRLKPHPAVHNLNVVSLLGGIGSTDVSNYTMFANSICEIIAANYTDCCMYPIYAPLIADSPSIAKAFLATQPVRSAFEKMQAMDIALVGAGGKSDYTASIDGQKDCVRFLDQLQTQQSVGNICSHFYDVHGNICETVFDKRAIAVSVQTLRQTPAVICATSGSDRVDTVIGGARASLFNMLVTDEATANQILVKEL